MSDRTDALPAPMTRDDKVMPMVVYGLYLAGFPTCGVTTLIGFIMAYAMKANAGERACSHYIFQIRTVWIALFWGALGGALVVLGLPLTLILIGFLFWKLAFVIFGLLGVWYLIRCIVGLIYIAREEAYPRPRAWLF
jgi:uncharacterized membrane protein